MSEYVKYPRTYHFPWSPGTSSDDRLMTPEDIRTAFEGRNVVVTEKLDGENTTFYSDHVHARSLDSRPHPSQNWVRQLHASIAHEIPKWYRICGENVYAKHSIYYDRLSTFFYVFSIWDDSNQALSWPDTQLYASLLGLETVPTLYNGLWDESAVKACWTGKSVFGDEQEGYVCRVTDSFPFPDTKTEKHEMPVFTHLGKFVRPKHVQTDDHWRMTWTPNKRLTIKPEESNA